MVINVYLSKINALNVSYAHALRRCKITIFSQLKKLIQIKKFILIRVLTPPKPIIARWLSFVRYYYDLNHHQFLFKNR